MKKRILALALAILMLLSLTACGGNKATDGNATDGNVSAGDLSDVEDSSPTAFFTKFKTTGLDGKEYTQKVFEGNKITMVNVWGTFCDPCISEMPALEMLNKNYADKGLVVIGIVTDVYDYFSKDNDAERTKKAEQILADAGVTYLNLLPSESLNEAKLNYISTYPTTYFLNEKGEILGEYVASRSYDQWAAIVDSILAA